MGSPVLSGLTTGANVAQFFGSPSGSNLRITAPASKVAGLANLGTGLTAEAATVAGHAGLAAIAGMAAGITLGIGAALILVSYLFHGADPNQVPAAQTEQAFEAAARDLEALANNGYLTQDEFQAALPRIIAAGQTYFQQIMRSPEALRDPRPFRNGLAHMVKIISEMRTGAPNAPASNPKPWYAPAGEALYIQNGARGWYSKPGESVEAGKILATGYMNALRGIRVQKISKAAGSPKIKKASYAVLAAGAALLALHFL